MIRQEKIGEEGRKEGGVEGEERREDGGSRWRGEF